METTPPQLKKANIFLFMTPRQRVAFSLTNKTEMKWMRPILRFMDLPVADKIVFIKGAGRIHLTDDIIVEAFSKEPENVILRVLTELPTIDKNKGLKQKLERFLEKRLCNRNYKKLIKKTLLKNYIQYLLQENKSVAHFLNRIDSPEVKSQAIGQYLILTQHNLTPTTKNKWIQRIPDEYTREKTKKMVSLS